LLVLEVKSSLPRHFAETGRWVEAGPDCIRHTSIHRRRGSTRKLSSSSASRLTKHSLPTTIISPRSWPSAVPGSFSRSLNHPEFLTL
jgi:hypothetical protein